MREPKERDEVRTEEIIKLAEMYKRMTPANRFFMVSASGLLLASQDNVLPEYDSDYLFESIIEKEAV